MQVRPTIKEMATFDLYLHLPRHIVAPAVRERTFEVVRTTYRKRASVMLFAQPQE